MREVTKGEHTRVVCLDVPGSGGACHKYRVEASKGVSRYYAGICFQDGPVVENRVNGCTNEDLLSIVLDRLEHFQLGDYACPENDVALDKVAAALFWLHRRTCLRQERGVEGKSVL
jgi:hypothetical protein